MFRLTKRLKTICSSLEKTAVLADVGCDHGYVAEYAVKNDIAKKVFITDISEKSLAKAKKLLSEYVGKTVFPIVTDGMIGLPSEVEEVVICGMGGEEIVKIISSADFLPKTFVLNPMKNAEKVRRLLCEKGYGLKTDYMFFDENKFYELIVASLDEKILPYSDLEFEFGRGNLQGNTEFLKFLDDKIAKISLSNEKTENQAVKLVVEKLRGLKDEVLRNI